MPSGRALANFMMAMPFGLSRCVLCEPGVQPLYTNHLVYILVMFFYCFHARSVSLRTPVPLFANFHKCRLLSPCFLIAPASRTPIYCLFANCCMFCYI